MTGAECLQSLSGFEFSCIKIKVSSYYLQYNSIYTPPPVPAARDVGLRSLDGAVFTVQEKLTASPALQQLPSSAAAASAASLESSC